MNQVYSNLQLMHPASYYNYNLYPPNIIIQNPPRSPIYCSNITPVNWLAPQYPNYSQQIYPNDFARINQVDDQTEKKLRIQITWKNVSIYPEPGCLDSCSKKGDKSTEIQTIPTENQHAFYSSSPHTVHANPEYPSNRTLIYPFPGNQVLHYPNPSSPQNRNDQKLILNNVSGTVFPGQFLTIIGASGSGKTTLLSFLSGKNLAKNLVHQGEVLVNGISRENVDYSILTAFVQQDDVLTDFMSVRENIFFACQLRAPSSEEEMNARCDELIKSLGLYHVQHQRIGGVMKKIISGGERKRTSIAVELISRTPLIFLDEPTTGLDSVMATRITESLSQYAKKGNTIIATIHQPNSEMFKLFDQLMLLSQGRTLYFNRADGLIDYFKGLRKPKYICPQRMNPAEFAMVLMSSETFTELSGQGKSKAILSHDQANIKFDKRVKKLVNYYERSSQKCNVEAQAQNLSELSQENINSVIYRADLLTQTKILFSRAMKLQLRKFIESAVRYVAVAFMALLTIAIYYNLSSIGPSLFQDRMGIFMMFAMVGFMTSMNSAITTFPEERAVFMREQVSGLYEVFPYYAGKLLCEYPFVIIDPIIIQILLYWSCKLRNEGSIFFTALACGILLSFYGYAFSLFLGIVVAKREAVFLAMPVVFIPLMLLSGFYADLSQVFPILWIFQWISPFKYGLMIFMRNEMSGMIYEYNIMKQGAARFVSGDVILDSFGFDLPIGISFLALALLFIGFTILGYVMIKIFVWRMKS